MTKFTPGPSISCDALVMGEMYEMLREVGELLRGISNARGQRGLIDLSDDCRLAAEDIRALLARIDGDA